MSITDRHLVDALYEGFPDPVVIVDGGRVIVSANPATQKQFGYSTGELVGQPARILYASDMDYALCLEKGTAAPNTVDLADSVYRYRRKNGQVFSARLRLTRFGPNPEDPDGFIGVVHDISDFLELDEERRKASDLLDTALKTIPEGLALFDREDRLLIFNDAYRKVCGAIGDRLHAGMKAEAIIRAAQAVGNYPDMPPGHPDTDAWIGMRMQDFHEPDGSEPVFAYADGRWLRSEQRRTWDGNTLALRVDVTDLKEAQLALERQRLEYYTLVQNIPDFISRISVDLRFTFVNDRFAAFLELPANEIIGRAVFDFAPEEEHAPLTTALRSLTPDTPKATREQKRQRADGGDIWIFWSNIAIYDQGTLVEYVTVGRDITAIKQQESRIARQSVELQRKNEALNQFTGTVSHDLKAPLRHLAMFSEMITEDLAAGNLKEIPVYAQHLRQSARRMDQLISSLLDYARITDQMSRWQTISMHDMIADALLNLDSFIRESRAQIDIGAMPQVWGDPELLKRLCQNVIGNAIKYSRDGVEPMIRIYAESAGAGMAKVCFEDNGIGIDPKFGKKIFDVFQRLHRDESKYPGTGIGLALTKRIVESHSGSIELDSSYTKGARFIVTLPASV